MEPKIKREPKSKTPEQALQSRMRMCARSERSSGDALRLMKRWGVADDAARKVLSRLQSERFIDDSRYAEAFVRDKYRFNKWGRIKIVQGLRMKGIDSATVNEAMEVIDEAEYLHILRELIKAKRKSIRGKSDYEVNGKLIRFAIGRGFEFAAIRSCMDVDENYGDSEGWD